MTDDTGTEKRVYEAVMIPAKREDIVIARAFLSRLTIRYCSAVVGERVMVDEKLVSLKEDDKKNEGEDDIIATIRDLSQAVANLSQAVPKLIEKVLDNYIPLLLIDEVERLLNRKLSVSERSRVVELVNSGLGLDDIVAQLKNGEQTAQYA